MLDLLNEVQDMSSAIGTGEVDVKKVREVDKRLKGCTNPEKIPGTALYVSLRVPRSKANEV